MKNKVEERSFKAGPIGPYIDPEVGDFGVNDDMVPFVIDLGSSRRGDLDESFIAQFGGFVETIMQRMFGGLPPPPFKIKGTRPQIDSFAGALNGEKKYLDAAKEHGLDDPRTYKNKGKLDKAVAQFERATGLKWPFK